MEKNMGKADSIIRLLMASGLIIVYFSEHIRGWPGITALSAAAILVLTGLSGFCPLYNLFNFHTTQKDKK